MSFFSVCGGQYKQNQTKNGQRRGGIKSRDHEPENVFDETIYSTESSDDKINLLSKGEKRKSKKGRKRRKCTWKDSTTGNLADCICSNECTKNKLIFTNIKASKNTKT